MYGGRWGYRPNRPFRRRWGYGPVASFSVPFLLGATTATLLTPYYYQPYPYYSPYGPYYNYY